MDLNQTQDSVAKFRAKQGLSLFRLGALWVPNVSQIAEMKEQEVLLPMFHYVY